MSANIAPVQYQEHKALKVNVDANYKHVSNQHMIPLVASEFIQAATSFPIVFVKQRETGKFKAIALTGFDESENVVFTGDKVNANYIPLNVRRHPFSIGAVSANSEDMLLCIDLDSATVNQEQGVALFNEDETLTKEIESVGRMLTDLLAKDEATTIMVDFLVEHDLIQPADLTLRLADETKQLNGLYKVDEEALRSLEDDVALALYKKHYFPAIYAHLSSLNQIQRLLSLKAQQV